MNSESLVAQSRRRALEVVRAVRSENPVFSRYLFNAGPVLQHRRRPPALSPAADQVLADLREHGVAMVPGAELLDGSALIDATAQRAAELLARPDLVTDPAKPFLIELLGAAPAVDPAEPLMQLALHPQIRGIAESYARMQLRVQDANIWVNRAIGSNGPIQSQRWHRDLPEDFDIVKCFVYLSDVPDGAGPLQYVTGTNTRDGRKVDLPTEFDGIGHRLTDADVESTFGAERIVTARAAVGTLVFADTRGIHRGGFARDAERTVGQITYASQACTRPRNLRPAPGVPRHQLRDFRLAR